MAISLSLFSGNNRLSTVPAGSAAKAASVGAKTVKGPLPLKVSTRPAALTAATNVLKLPAATAVSTIFMHRQFTHVMRFVNAAHWTFASEVPTAD
jgi:hypothetical protein